MKNRSLALVGLLSALLTALTSGMAQSPKTPLVPARNLLLEAQVLRVLDCDTLEVVVEKRTLRVHLWGLACPEVDQTVGAEAGLATRELALGQVVNLSQVSRLETGELCAVVTLPDGQELGRELVRAGLARVNHELGDSELLRLEREARQSRLGLWRSASSILASQPPTTGAGRACFAVEPDLPAKPIAQNCIPRRQCTRVCTMGQACGNSCISASYTCHKGRGGACNSWEVCN